jgi:hypothetical protein
MIVVALPLGVLSSQSLLHHQQALAGPAALQLAIDSNPDPGPCSSIDAAGSRYTPSTSSVDICLKNPLGHSSFSLTSIIFRIVYDDTVIAAPNVISGPTVDRNPDLDQAVVTGSFSCAAAASGDEDPLTGPAHGVAHLFCSTAANDGPAIAGGSTYRIASLNFQAVGAVGASTSLVLRDAVVTGNGGAEIGSCNPPLYQQMTCSNGSIDLPSTSLGGVAEYPALRSGGEAGIIAAAAAVAALIGAAGLGGLAWRRRTIR